MSEKWITIIKSGSSLYQNDSFRFIYMHGFPSYGPKASCSKWVGGSIVLLLKDVAEALHVYLSNSVLLGQELIARGGAIAISSKIESSMNI